MRKTLLFLSVFLLFGCSKLNQNVNDYHESIKTLIENKNNFVNQNLNGYKLYIPKGITIEKAVANNIMLNCENTKLYLNIDLISYFYKNTITFNEIEKFDYYKKLDNEGFLIVDENNDKYFVMLSYNYSTIEFYTTKENIPILLTNSAIILNNIKFNDFIIEKDLIDNNSSNEKKYSIKDFEKNESSFSKYLNSYVEEKEETNILPD